MIPDFLFFFIEGEQHRCVIVDDCLTGWIKIALAVPKIHFVSSQPNSRESITCGRTLNMADQ